MRLGLLIIAVTFMPILRAWASDPTLATCAEYQLLGKLRIENGAMFLDGTGPSGIPLTVHLKKASNQLLLNGLNGFLVQSRVVISSQETSGVYRGTLKSVSLVTNDDSGGASDAPETTHLITKMSCGPSS